MLKLHFYANEKLFYCYDPVAYFWLFIKQWQEVAPELGIDMIIGPSENAERLSKDYTRQLGRSYMMPSRDNTFIEVNDKHIVFFDAVDDQKKIEKNYPRLTEGWVDLVLKCQYKPKREPWYRASPFKVVPFTFFTDGNKEIYKYRPLRKEIMKKRDFKYSMIWSGRMKMQKTRQWGKKFIIEETKKGKADWWKSREAYYEDLIHSMCGVGIKSMGEFTSRDFEYMGIGVPMIRKHYNDITRNPLIPNVHYMSIGGDEAQTGPTLAHYRDYFEPNGELREFSNEEWDQYQEIVHNAMEWWEHNSSPKGSLKLLVEILEEHNLV